MKKKNQKFVNTILDKIVECIDGLSIKDKATLESITKSKNKNQEFVNTVWDKTVEEISKNPDIKDWFDGLLIEDKAALEVITKGIAMTTRQPELLPIDIENGPEADIKYFDKK